MTAHSTAVMRRLAIAVLSQAFFDAAGLAETRAPSMRNQWRGGSVRGSHMSAAEIAAEAYDWLTTPSERLAFWAECAGLDEQTVIDGADAAIAYAKRTPRGESILNDVRRVTRVKGRK